MAGSGRAARAGRRVTVGYGANVFDLVVRGGTVVAAGASVTADIGVAGGRVAAIGRDLTSGVNEVDASGLNVLPGLIDVHVHFREPGMTAKEDFGSGSRAAAAGGVTTVFDMPNTSPPVATAALLTEKRALAERHAHIDFGLYGVVLPDNEAELDGIAASGAIGFKLFMGETMGENPCPDDAVIFGALRRAAAAGVVVGVHAENNPILQRLTRELRDAGRTDPRAQLESRPEFVEAEAVARITTIAGAAGARVHIHHLSTKSGLERVLEARARGVQVTCEALVAHLLLDDGAYADYGNLIKLNPPIREHEHVAALWEGLLTDAIDCIATDHAPHTIEEQGRENVWDAFGGFIGVETMLPLLLTEVARGKLSLERLVRATSERPAQIFGIYPRKGSLFVGADADFVLVDLNRTSVIDASRLHSLNPVTPYDRWPVQGVPVATYLRGIEVARDGSVIGDARGRMITRAD